jgi:hypothetical protein
MKEKRKMKREYEKECPVFGGENSFPLPLVG